VDIKLHVFYISTIDVICHLYTPVTFTPLEEFGVSDERLRGPPSQSGGHDEKLSPLSCRKSDYGHSVTFIRKAGYTGDFYHLMLGSQLIDLTLKYKSRTV
jgi:hypothetical protein